VLGTLISTWQAILATRARDAERQARAALDAAREEKDQQRLRTNRELGDALAEAARLREKVQDARPGDTEAANQLRATLARGAPWPAGGRAARALAARRQALKEGANRAPGDRRMGARLEEIRLPQGTLPRDGLSRTSAAFREYGIPITDFFQGNPPA